jgi:uncharacterized membrane protein YjjP (DUF1212 family)/uncharacterized membrane protein YjjB (DUF3815 family)
MTSMETTTAVEARRRAVRVTLRLGVLMLTTGAQAQEAETSLREVMEAFGLRGGDAIVTFSSVTVSYVAPGDAQATTAIQAVRATQYNFGQLAAAGQLAQAIKSGKAAIPAAELELDRIEAMVVPYPRLLLFFVPAVQSAAITILFDGSLLDILATFAIGVVIQPVLARLERSPLPLFFQVVVGVSATALLVVLLLGLHLPIDGSLVLTGGLLRFLPGAQLVAGMRDLIARAIGSGTANLAEVFLLGLAIALSTSLVLGLGKALGVDLRISATGAVHWAPLIKVAAGTLAVTTYAIRLGVPPRALPSVAMLGALVVVVAQGILPSSRQLDRNERTLLAALLIGLIGRALAQRSGSPAAHWLIPTILPLLPAPATLVPMLAESEQVRDALRMQALMTAYLIGAGVASGDILATAFHRYRTRRATPAN